MRPFLLIALILVALCAKAQNITNVAILGDFSGTSVTSDVFSAAVQSFIASKAGTGRFTNMSVAVYNTQGSVLTAAATLSTMLTTPDVLVVADSVTVTKAVQSIVTRDARLSNALFVSTLASNPSVCDRLTNPTTVCLVPLDFTGLTAALEITGSRLGWGSIGVMFTNDDYGTALAAGLDTTASAISAAPTIVSRAYMPTGSVITDSAVDAALRSVVAPKPVGILCFVTPADYTRIVASKSRLGLQNVFFILAKGNLNSVNGFAGDSVTGGFLAGAVLAPYYTLTPLATLLGGSANLLDNVGAFILSNTLDALSMVAAAANLSPDTVLGTTLPTSFTSVQGNLTWDAVSGRRKVVSYALQTRSYAALISWTLTSGAGSAITDTANGALPRLIPASPLRAVKVCMTSPPTCSDVANLGRLLAYTLQSNANNAASGTAIIPVPINVGLDGVSGLSTFIPVAKSCHVLTGPGRFTINSVLSPIINTYSSTQIDYTTGNPALSNKIQYPAFNRVIPSDAFNLKVLASVAYFMNWERVVVLTTADAYGQSMAKAAQDAMDERVILVEELVQLTAITPESLTQFFADLRDKYISRIVLPLLPVTDVQAALFINLWKASKTDSTIFMFNNLFCQYLQSNPAMRLLVPSSICAVPTFNATMINEVLPTYTQQIPTVRDTLFNAGFDMVGSCDLSAYDPYSVFAIDAALALQQAVTNVTASGQLINGSNIMKMVRNVIFQGVTGSYYIDSNGDRTSATYNVNVQGSGWDTNITTFGLWSNDLRPNFRYLLPTRMQIVWLDNSTTFPPSTVRSITFIAQTTLTANPGTIAMSILGFIGTFLVFGFCYRHYRTQMMLEFELDQIDRDYEEKNQEKSGTYAPAREMDGTHAA